MFAPQGTISPVQAIPPLIFPVVCLAFWGWMFRDMLNNEATPPGIKETWTWLFVLLNVFAAALYYANVYRGRR